MKILFMGYAIDNYTANIQKGASVAGNNMQLNIIKELSNFKESKVEVITVYPTAPYPKGEILISRERIELMDSIFSLRIGFLNLPIFKQLIQMLNVFLESRKLVKSQKIDTILTFNMYPTVSLPAIILKKLYKVKLVSILADPPVYDKINKGLKSVLKKCFMNISSLSIKHCDEIIVLNKFAAEKFAPNINYLVVDGGIGTDKLILDEMTSNIPQNIRNNIVFTGALTKYNGIIEVVEAMSLLADIDLKLDIYGDGELKEYVENQAYKSNNIRFYGKKDNKYVMKKQKEAFLLINPRRTDDEISKVTFPSKIFEYMLSGVPILSSLLNGFTDEYKNKLYFIESVDKEEIAKKIREIYMSSLEERNLIAARAKDFVKKEKNWEKQTLNIYNFLNK